MISSPIATRAPMLGVAHSRAVRDLHRIPVVLGSLLLLLAAGAAHATPPTLNPIGNQSVREGANLNIGLSASDPDPGDQVNFSASGLPGFCSLSNGPGANQGSISCSPGAGTANTYAVTVTATDTSLAMETDSETFNIVVTANTAPTISNINNQTVEEGGSVTIAFTSNDADGDNMSFSTSGRPGFCALNNGNGSGSIVCNPGSNDAGTYNITVTVTDDAPIPGQDSEGFQLTVTENNPPVLTNISNQSMAEGESLTIPLSATDPDGDNMSFSTSGLPSFCTLNNGNGSGSIVCNPGAGTANNYNITVTVTDDGLIPAQDSDSFTLSVGANAAPQLTPISNQSVTEGDSINIPLSATDPDGDNMSFSTSGLPSFCSLNNGNGSGSIDCSPQLGDAGNYPITVTVTDDGTIPASDSDSFVLNVGANQAPTASNVTISGNPAVGEVLTGDYDYDDAENDPEGTSTFRWLRDGAAIGGETGRNYTVVAADVETDLQFEVTPVATSGTTQGSPVRSGVLRIENTPPTITGQAGSIQIQEDTSRQITLSDVTVSDPDNTFPDDFTIRVRNGANYSRSGATITPDLNYNGPLTVPVTVNDGFDDSPVFNLSITVTAVNDAPSFEGVRPPGLSTPEDSTLTIDVSDLDIDDPDNPPSDFVLTLDPMVPPDANYTLSSPTSVTPAENYNGQINVLASVSDGELDSAQFTIPIDVDPVNDLPVLEAPIGSQNAVEDSPFALDVSPNFSDADGEALTYTAVFVPEIPPERGISFDGATGQFSGVPDFEDDDPPDPVYIVTIRAEDPAGEFVEDIFDLTLNQLGRANLGLDIGVSPESALPNDELRWTFSTDNPVGPAPGENVELTGSFIGDGVAVRAEGGANCTINSLTGRVDFVCQVGGLPVGGSVPVVLSTTPSQATEVVAFATSAGAARVPIDPNPANNSAVRAVGVAESFSLGAVQILGNAGIMSVAAGDVNGDGAVDIVAGTESGRPVQIYLGAALRESCNCQRDFESTPLSVPDTGPNQGVALADVDNNGTLDLVVANNGGQPDNVYFNDGLGNFTAMDPPLAASNARGVAVGDFNNDGNADIAIAANSPNPVYLGDGNGGFGAPMMLGDGASADVAVGRFNGDDLDDLVFANVSAAGVAGGGRVWTANQGGGFSETTVQGVGDAAAVAAADLNADGLDDLVFGRVPADVGDISSNPVLINQGGAAFAAPLAELGISPTNDVLIGDVTEDGQLDLVFINSSGVHQIWAGAGGSFALHGEQIIDIGAAAGVIAPLGDADDGDPGGPDLAIGSAPELGVGVYLNDSAGNLGRGDAVPPVITLNGNASVDVPSGSVYTDSGATAEDNIDGSLTPAATSNVNTAVVGSYTVTYNVADSAGNAADPVSRTVNVTPASGRGGGGGGALGLTVLAVLAGLHLLILVRARVRVQRCGTRTSERAEDI